MSTIRDDHQPISIQEIELESEMRSYYEMMTSSAKSSLDDLRMKLAEASNNYFAFIEGKENGEIPDVKVKRITDDQVPDLIEKATKFCQDKFKKKEFYPNTMSQSSNQIQAKRPLKPTPKITLTTTQLFGGGSSAFHRFSNERGSTETKTQGSSGVMLVQKDGIKPYTKITSSVQQKKRHNFDNLKIPLQHQGVETLRTELRRSCSVPSKNLKQKVFRTGSHVVAGSTLYRLKTSIRNGTSAALIRKPSITDQEISQISDENSDDSDSDYSSSDDEYFDDVTGGPASKKSKPSPPIMTSQMHVVMTTAK